MAFQPALGTAGIVVRQSLDGQQIENTLYVNHGETAWLTDDLATLATTIETWFLDNILTHLATELTYRETVATDLTVEGGAQAVSATGAGSAGGASGGSAPGNVALCLSIRTGLSGRSNRGRNYVGGVPLSQITGTNTFASGWVDALIAGYAALGAALLEVDGSWVWSVLSRVHDRATRTTALAIPATNVLAVDLTVDSQRRRLPGRGA